MAPNTGNPAYPWAAGATITPPPPDVTRTGDRPNVLAAHERARYTAAASHAKRLYPGAAGEILAREINAHVEFGFRYDDGKGGSLISRLVDDILKQQVSP